VKPRPSALERYLVAPETLLDLPPDWAGILGRPAPLGVELGFGNGEFLAWWARRCPDWNLVGLERPPECVVRASAVLEEEGLDNVRLVRGDGRTLLRELFAPASVRRVVVQFPMPWPKERHAKHRVTRPGLAATLADILEPGGEFELVTDQEWFGREAWEVLAAADAFTMTPLETDPERPFRTRYESRWLAEGRSIFRFTARLERPRPAPRLFRSTAMQHVHLEATPAPEAVEGLVGARVSAGDRVGEVKEAFTARNGWLLKVVAADGSFSQVFWLRLVCRSDGRGLLKIEDRPRPYNTPAVGFLVEAVGRRLAAASGGGPRESGG